VLRAALRDLQWRRRRFAIAMAGVALVFAMSLIMTGLSAAFAIEANRTLDAIGAERWLVPEGSSGPFTAIAPLPAEVADAIPDGVPIVVLRQTVGAPPRDLNLFGVVPGSLGAATVRDGRALDADGQLVADSGLGLDVGEHVEIGGVELEVVGTTSGLRLYGGVPNVYVTIADAQRIGFAGQPLVTAVLTADAVEPPAGLAAMTKAQVRRDVLRPLDNAITSITFVQVLLWIVAASIIGSVLYLSALERSRDFAVFKATGTSTAAIGLGLALQAVVLSLVAALTAAVLGTLLAPLFPLTIEIPTSAYALLPVITVGVGLASSLVALHRTVKVEPALAFGG
jgi:putative ABC transport system permease protein